MQLPVISSDYQHYLQEFEQTILKNHSKIEAWFRSQWKQHQPPFYGSVDIRNAGYKIASIDMNLFPGGFNNLNPNFIPLATIAAQDAIERACETAKSVLLIPENHTRNTYYLQNVYALATILRNAGFEVRIGSFNPELTEATEFETALGDKLLIEPLQRTRERVHLADGFSPCFVLLNNDLSAGIPEILQGISQTVLPPLHGSWTTRRKTHHFEAYNQVAKEFAELLQIDEWQINPYFEQISGLNFQEREGEDALADAVERVLAKIQAKYDEKGITDKPFVIVKADAGTYGMGVMSVKSADEVRGLNRKNRNKMAKVKEGLEVSEVIVQEGIYTYETLNGAVSEPVVYMMDRFVIGGFFRVHEGRGNDENLNAGGMVFVPLNQSIPNAGSTNDSATQEKCKRVFEQWDELGMASPDAENPDCSCNRLYVYGVMARLSLLAASLELAK
ncbi:glutamate--cysteine ligase [Kingella negevensis]|uniref:glutamate--cysteine ligase n=1 Tax=Kingella negevensis TaxID=1522312 RepID=UPI0025438DFD|nr:glutamate--cysteine ligase [Kingella negevensis]MDK4679711.1 glutamate--cysteine ligase [Kingella negevensis]MDK4682570.1 glutamate--cysteine ligase [Kingella negevensis]MDK4690767.1 glutamate--cysteine ligase [Kingella negevensis]MDK4694085.1 glutamate--cysteine ligase [Kingella negevensis]MDK4699814.1 glutamate--cysteine ligase [Kingella negevensis]